MLKNKLTGLDKKKLRRWLLLFFFALAIPTAILIQQSYSRLKWETFHQHQSMATELSNRIDAEFLRLIDIEEQRSFTDYSFLNVVGDPKASLLQRSPLSNYPIESDIAGLIGYFQIDNEGKLKTPLLPETIKPENSADLYGIADKELASRSQLQNQIQTILSQNSLVKATSVSSVSPSVVAKAAAKKDEKRDTSAFGGLLGSSASDSVSSSESFDAESEYQEKPVIESKSKQVTPNSQIAFDRLKTAAPKLGQRENKLGRIEDLKLSQNYSNILTPEALEDQRQEIQNKEANKRKAIQLDKFSQRARARTEQNVLPDAESYEQKAANTRNKNIALKKSPQLKPSLEEVANPVGSSINEGVSSAVTTNQPINQSNNSNIRIRTFESSIDPFEFSQLDSGHFVLFRNVWLNEKRYIQGLLIEQRPFLESVVNSAFGKTALSQMSELIVSYQGNILSAFSDSILNSYPPSKNEMSGELLYQTRLSAPLSGLQLLYSVKQLPIGAGGKIILWLSFLLGSVLLAGFYLMYRLGLGQIKLANQQQDFVSAVSHELKTPLTSIRMYSEMLREGWANEDKKKNYYDFIFDESERLSRLINNVLHLARVTRNKQSAELKLMTAAELIDGVRSKVSTQIDHAGFELEITCDDSAENKTINVDEDWFSQIMINLVDNAIKFSAKAEKQKIDISCSKQENDQIQFSVRDYGQGVDKTQMKKIFDLFYRTESELTRETVGTGIGLALVHQMVVGMDGKIDVVNRKPGAEFRLFFS